MADFVAHSVAAIVGFELGFILQETIHYMPHCSHLVNPVGTFVKLAHDLGKTTLSIRKSKGEVQTFQEF